jgi:hypothetical protein
MGPSELLVMVEVMFIDTQVAQEFAGPTSLPNHVTRRMPASTSTFIGSLDIADWYWYLFYRIQPICA